MSIGPVGVAEAMVIDFGGRLASLRLRACAYEDLSPSGDASEACVRVFALLREAEGGAMEARGVRAVLLPDLRQASQGDELLQVRSLTPLSPPSPSFLPHTATLFLFHFLPPKPFASSHFYCLHPPSSSSCPGLLATESNGLISTPRTFSNLNAIISTRATQ